MHAFRLFSLLILIYISINMYTAVIVPNYSSPVEENILLSTDFIEKIFYGICLSFPSPFKLISFTLPFRKQEEITYI